MSHTNQSDNHQSDQQSDASQATQASFSDDQNSENLEADIEESWNNSEAMDREPYIDNTAIDPLDEPELTDLTAKLELCQLQLTLASEAKQRALADYQNLQRRTEQDRIQMAKLATRSLASDLIEHFDHLSMAAEHAKDPALSMIVQQLWQTLNNHGLAEIQAIGKKFDPQIMEAVSASGKDTDSAEIDIAKSKVTKVIQRGYTLHGIVLRPAKVAL